MWCVFSERPSFYWPRLCSLLLCCPLEVMCTCTCVCFSFFYIHYSVLFYKLGFLLDNISWILFPIRICRSALVITAAWYSVLCISVVCRSPPDIWLFLMPSLLLLQTALQEASLRTLPLVSVSLGCILRGGTAGSKNM